MAGINIASAKLLQDAAQETTRNILQKQQMEQAAREAAQRNAIEGQLRDIQQSRYDAQAAHYTALEAAQAEAARIHEENNEKQVQATLNKTQLDQHIADLSKASDNMKNTMGGLAQSVVLWKSSGGKKGISPDVANTTVQRAFGGLTKEQMGAFKQADPVKYDQIMNGGLDYDTIAKGYEAQQSGKGGARNEAAGRQYQDAIDKDMEQLKAGPTDGDTDSDEWKTTATALVNRINSNQAILDKMGGNMPEETKTTSGFTTDAFGDKKPSGSTTSMQRGTRTPSVQVPQASVGGGGWWQNVKDALSGALQSPGSASAPAAASSSSAPAPAPQAFPTGAAPIPRSTGEQEGPPTPAMLPSVEPQALPPSAGVAPGLAVPASTQLPSFVQKAHDAIRQGANRAEVESMFQKLYKMPMPTMPEDAAQ